MEIQKTALYNCHKSLGAKFVPFAGYEMPVQYTTGIVEEHKLTRNKSGFFDVSHMGQLFIEGTDNLSTELEKIIPIDLKKIKLNQSKYSFLTNDKGGIYDDLIVTKVENGFNIILNAACKNNDLAIIKNGLKDKFKITLHNDLSLIAIQGPESAKILEKLISYVSTLKFMNGNKFSYKNKNIYITRSGYTGEDGFEISLFNNLAEDFVKELMERGAKPIGLGARDTLRLEAGLCLYGNEINEEINPIESGLSWVFDKKRMHLENFYGARSIKNNILNRPFLKRYGFKINEKCIARHGMEVKNNLGIKRGYITSGCFSPTLDKSICMGLIDSKWDEKEELFVSIRKKIVKITKVDLPFVEHKYHNKKRKDNE